MSVLATKVLEYAVKYLAKSTMRQLIKRIFAVGAMSLALARRATATTQQQQQQQQQQQPEENEEAVRKNWVFHSCEDIMAIANESTVTIGGGSVVFAGSIECETATVRVCG